MRNQRLWSVRRPFGTRLVVLVVLAIGSLILLAEAAPAVASNSGTVLQTNLVSDLPGVAATQDPNLVNPWGISESPSSSGRPGSPFWVSDNNAGVATLYSVSGATPITTNALVVSIPTPVSPTGGTPTGTVFNTDGGAGGGFPITGVNASGQPASASAIFLFATEDGTITGWNPGVNPPGLPNPGTHAVIAVDNSGNNFTEPDPNLQTGAVYKGLAIATGATPIIPADPDSTALLYVTNFRAGTVEVYDSKLHQVTALPAGAFTDPALRRGYAPFNVQVLNGKVYVTYARQNAARHDDVAGPHRGFVDVFNLDGTPGLPNKAVRLISRGPLDSPWGLAMAPAGFAGFPSTESVLLVGNFGNGHINAFDATTGARLGQLTDPDGEPIRIDGLWALKVGNGGNGGFSDTVYFTAGLFSESHGLFGSLATVASGSPEGPAEAQWVQANADIVQLDQGQLAADEANGAPPSTIRQDKKTLKADTRQLIKVQRAFAADTP